MDRKVTFTVYDTKKNMWLNHIPGTFHQWGNTVVELDEKHFQQTIAIVESPIGQIFEVEPKHVFFTK